MKKTVSILFLGYLSILTLLGVFVEDKMISTTERRLLTPFPEYSHDSLLSGEYLSSMEGYLLDHMPLRDNFRSIKVAFETYIFKKKDINEYFVEGDYIFKIEYPYDSKMGKDFVAYVEEVTDTVFANNKIFVSIIPDKSYFASDQALKMDYELLQETVLNGNYNYIDLFNVLSLEDYYYTDPHWKQEALEPVVKHLLKALEVELMYDFDDMTSRAFEPFYGAYSSQYGLGSYEILQILTHSSNDHISIFDYEMNEEIDMYDINKFEGIDPYDIYLNGGSPLIEITNHDISTDKELIIFRDSFSSSLVPLLVGSYKKITLVDTRYMGYDYLDEFIDITNQDVLFLYSTLVVNNSVILR